MHSTTNKGFSEKKLSDFIQGIKGNVMLPDHEGYPRARKVYNAMIDRYPALVVQCRDVTDVIACIAFSRDQRLVVAVRGGGHNGGGLGTVNDGLVIDLSLMKGTRINPDLASIRVEGGCLLRDIDHVTQPFGKAVPTGIFSTTGISGLTLGGGLGHLSRAYGLSIDSLLEADVVLANGTLVTASESSHPDLFWAIRGGGGNFGIAISFKFRLHDAGTVQGGPMLWSLEDAEEIMSFYQDFILTAPDHIYGYFAFLTVPPVPVFPEALHLKKMCGIVWCNLGPVEESDRYVQKFRNLKTPELDYVAPMPFASLQGLFDDLYPAGLQWYWKTDFVKALTSAAIQENVRHVHQFPTTLSTVHFYPVNGKCQHKAKGDTAWNYRDANWAQVIVGVDPDPANSNAITQWAQEYWAGIRRFSAGGGYINFMMEETQADVEASYGENYGRLKQIKRKYDPENFFRVNQNIKP